MGFILSIISWARNEIISWLQYLRGSIDTNQLNLLNYEGYFFQGPIGREIRTTIWIRWSFVQMCCTMSLVCPSIATHRTCQFWARCEPVNTPKTIESLPKCGVRAVIRFLYLEASRNVGFRYFPFSWQCSAAHFSCDKETPEAFSMEVFDHPPSSAQTWLPVIFISFLVWIRRRRTSFLHKELQTRLENSLKAQAAGFYDESTGKLVPRYEKV